MIIKLFKTTILIIVLTIGFTNLVNASYLSPSILDIQINIDTEQKGSLEYLNTSGSTVYLRPLILAYDSKNETIIDKGSIFLTTEDMLYEVEDGHSVEIPYSIHSKKNIVEGTYFNVLAMISQTDSNNLNNIDLDESQFNINIGEGALFALHVKENGKINAFQELDVELTSSSDWFIPYIFPVIARVTIINNSNFVFDVGGELKSIRNSGEVLNVDGSGSRFQKLYPHDSIEIVSSADLDSLNFDDISFVYTLGENISDQQDTNVILVKNYSLYLVVSLGIIMLLALSFLLKRRLKTIN